MNKIKRLIIRLAKLSKIKIKRDLRIIYATQIDPNLSMWHKKSFLFFLPYKKFLQNFLEKQTSKNHIIDIGSGIAEIHLKHKYKLLLFDNSFSCLRAASRIIGTNHKAILCDFFEKYFCSKIELDDKNKVIILAINILHNHVSNLEKVLYFAKINKFKKLVFDIPKNMIISNYLKFIPEEYEINKIYDGESRMIFEVQINTF